MRKAGKEGKRRGLVPKRKLAADGSSFLVLYVGNGEQTRRELADWKMKGFLLKVISCFYLLFILYLIAETCIQLVIFST